MKPKFRNHLLSFGTILLLVTSTQAAEYTFTVPDAFTTGSDNWSTDLKWNTVPASAPTTSLVFILQATGNAQIQTTGAINDIANPAGLTLGSVADGTYTLIDGTLGAGVFDGLANNSLATAYDIGGGRSAYFQEGSLQIVVTSVPEPSAALLYGFGALALVRR